MAYAENHTANEMQRKAQKRNAERYDVDFERANAFGEPIVACAICGRDNQPDDICQDCGASPDLREKAQNDPQQPPIPR